MSFFDLFKFALTALKKRRLRTSLSLLGVAIGIAAVVMLTALGEGARRYVINQFTSLGTNLLIVIPGKTETTGAMPGLGGTPHDLTLGDAEVILREVHSVEAVAPVTMNTESVAHLDRRRQVPVIGSTHELLEVRKLRMGLGQFLPPSEMDRGTSVVVLGMTVARELFPGQNPLGQVVRIGDWRMRVIGVLGRRGVQLGVDMDDVVIIPVATAMRMFNKSSLFRILVQVRAHTELDPTAADVTKVLKARHGEEDFTCVTQDSVVATFSSILTVLTLALSGIAGISLSVAGIGIMNVMLVSVSERTGEVGLLKAVGVRRHQILAVFLTEAILLGAAGGILGLAVGWGGVGVLVSIYPTLPATPPRWAVAAALLVSMGVGTLFGVLPAHRASRLDPVAALSRR
jgi:putative ABC transport system permease protein